MHLWGQIKPSVRSNENILNSNPSIPIDYLDMISHFGGQIKSKVRPMIPTAVAFFSVLRFPYGVLSVCQFLPFYCIEKAHL